MNTLAKWLYFRILGWKLHGNFPDVDKCVVIVVPHTSWIDFFLGLLVRRIFDKEVNFIGKQSLFKPPFGWYFRWMGGTPIDRSKHNDTVKSTVKIFNEREQFRLALSPEGTRKKVTKWKTGFYYIAKAAEVPIVLIAFDYGKKEVKVSEAIYTTDNKEEDFKNYKKFFEGVKGKIPEYS